MTRLPRHIRAGGHDHHLAVRPKGRGIYDVIVDGETVEVEAGRLGTHGFWFRLAGGRRHVVHAASCADNLQLRVDGRTWLLASAEPSKDRGDSAGDSDPTHIVAPMTGTIVTLLVEESDEVDVDDDLIVMTAMKMEYRLRARCKGTVVAIETEEGATVEAGSLLVRLEPI